MNSLIERTICCPYCAEFIDVLIDPSDEGQQYIEDCQVCCRPIVFNIATTQDGEPVVSVHSENEVY